MKDAHFNGTFPEFLKFLRTDPQFYAKTPQELLNDAAWIAKEFDDVADKWFGHLPRRRFGIVPVPADIAPYYTGGRGGPGIYLVNTYDLPARKLYSLPALTLHESAPGHAFQMPLAAITGRPFTFSTPRKKITVLAARTISVSHSTKSPFFTAARN